MNKIKKFFGKIKDWFVRHKPSKRKIVQLYAALLFNANIKGFFTGRIYQGATKNMCVPGLNCYSCPGAVGSCPLGAIYGFFSRIALLGVKIDQNKCTDCGLCVGVCKMDIKKVGDHECIHCGACVSVCPAKAISWKGSSLFVRANDADMPASTEVRPLDGLLKRKQTPVEQPSEEVALTSEKEVQSDE